MAEPRVAVLMGGTSLEHDVSMRSGAQVLSVLEGGVEVVIERSGAWTVAGTKHEAIGAALDDVRARADVVFVALHGPFGEDGTVQGFLQTAGLPYTGSGVAASSLAMDKVRTKLVYQASGLPTPDFAVFRPRGFEVAKVEAAAAQSVHLAPGRIDPSVVAFEGPRRLDEALDGVGRLFTEPLRQHHRRGGENSQRRARVLRICAQVPGGQHAPRLHQQRVVGELGGGRAQDHAGDPDAVRVGNRARDLGRAT